MQSTANLGKKCNHAVGSRLLTVFGLLGPSASESKRVSCAKILCTVLLFRRDLRSYFLKKEKETACEYKKVPVLWVGNSLYNKFFGILSRLEDRSEYTNHFRFLQRLFLDIFPRYTEAYIDYIEKSLDEYIHALKGQVVGVLAQSMVEVDNLFENFDIPENFCAKSRILRFPEKIAEMVHNICRGIKIYNYEGQDIEATYLTSKDDIDFLNTACDRNGWSFLEFFELVNSMFLEIDSFIVWRFFANEISGKDNYANESMSRILTLQVLFTPSSRYKRHSIAFQEYFEGWVLNKNSKDRNGAVNYISLEKSLTISQNFAAGSSKNGVGAVLGDSEVTKSSLSSILGESSSFVVQRQSDQVLLGEECQLVGLSGSAVFSSKSSRVRSGAVIRKKRKMLGDKSGSDGYSKEMVEGIRVDFREKLGKLSGEFERKVEELRGELKKKLKDTGEEFKRRLEECEALYDYTSSYTSPSCSLDEVLSSKLGFSMNALIRK